MRTYKIRHDGVAITAAITTVIEFTAPATKSCFVVRAWLNESTNVTSAQQRIALMRRTTASTNVTAPVAELVDGGDAAFGGTVRGMCTTLGTAGAIPEPDVFNWVNGYLWIPASDKEWIIVPGGGIFCMHLPVAPAALTVSAGLTVIELG